MYIIIIQNQIDKSLDEHANLKDQLNNLERMVEILENELEELDQELEEANAERRKNGGASTELEEEYKELGKELVRIKTLTNLKATSIKDEKASVQSLEKASVECEINRKNAEESVQKLTGEFQDTLKLHTETVENVQRLENLVQTITTGLSSSKGGDNGYLDQLASEFYSNRCQEATNRLCK